ncbi:MAG: hypothetical protein AB7V22_06645 [Kiritimatiellia bacterium]
MKTNELDRKLKEWAARKRPTEAALAELEAKIRKDLAAPPPAAEVRRGSAVFRGTAPLWLAAAAALALLLGGVRHVAQRRSAELRAANGNGSAALADFTAEQLAARRDILDEMESLFAGQVRWVRLDADGLRLGLAQRAVAAEPRAQRLAVRTVVVAREQSQKNWRTVWSSDVLTRTEEYVEIASEPGAAGGLEMWVHRLPDGRYVVDAEIDWPEARLPRVYETRVLSVGKPERILTQTAEGHEYRVYQSIEPLANGNG